MIRLVRRLAVALQRDRLDAELRADIDEHIAAITQAFVNEGVEAREARRRALIAVGNVTAIREDARAMWGFPLLDGLVQDLRYGLRVLRRSRVFTATAVLSLAIGVGAGAAVFSLADGLLFRKLAVTDPDALMVLEWRSGRSYPFDSLAGYMVRTAEGITSTAFSYDAYQHFKRDAASRVDVVAFAEMLHVNVAVDGRGESATAHLVSGDYFHVLGVTPVIGRPLIAADDRDTAVAAAVISDRWWERQFGRSPDSVGRQIAVNGTPFTIVGVLPRAFHGAGQAGTDPDVYVPLALAERISATTRPPRDPNFWWLWTVGRLRKGVAAADARAALDLALERSVMAVRPGFARENVPRLELLPGAHGQLEARGEIQGVIRTLGMVTAIVLLIACANVANLLLARGGTRSREMSVRVAIGASRARLVRQMAIEVLLITCGGALVGALFAEWLARALLPALATGQDPLVADVHVGGRVLLFLIALSSLSAFIFGIVPSLRSTDVPLVEALRENGRGPVSQRRRTLWLQAPIVLQIALSLLLGTAAGLLVRSVRNLHGVPLGFDPENVLLFRIDPVANGYKGVRAIRFCGQVLEAVRALPGVRTAGLSDYRLMTSQGSWFPAMPAEVTPPPFDSPQADAFTQSHRADGLIVDEQFFSTLSIPLVFGRTFRAADEGSASVVVVSRSLARKLFRTDAVVGRRVRFTLGADRQSYTIVGVSADSKYASLREPTPAIVYFYYRQRAALLTPVTLAVKTNGPPEALAASLRQLVGRVDPTLPVSAMTTQKEQIAQSVERETLFARLASILGIVAIVLCAVGVYGLLAYSLVRRTPELGIRMALGASPRMLFWMVLRDSAWLSASGVAVGVPAALWGTRVLESLLFGLPPRDPATIAGSALLISAVAILAGYVPARRAAKLDPAETLRA